MASSRIATHTKPSITPPSTKIRLRGVGAGANKQIQIQKEKQVQLAKQIPQEQQETPIQEDAQPTTYRIIINVGDKIQEDLLNLNYKICIGVEKAVRPDKFDYVLVNDPVAVEEYLSLSEDQNYQIEYEWTPTKEFMMGLRTQNDDQIIDTPVKPGKSYEITNADGTSKVELLDDDKEKTIANDVIVFQNQIAARTILTSAVGGVTQNELFDSEGFWVPGEGEIKIEKPTPGDDPMIQVWFSAEKVKEDINVKHRSKRSSAQKPVAQGLYIFNYDDSGVFVDEDVYENGV